MYTYLILNVFIIFVTFLLFLFNFINLRKYYLAFLISISSIGIIFIIWDYFSTQSKIWSFNNDFITNIKIIGLPFEEILFFITVPFSCIVIYEIFNAKIKEKVLNLDTNVFYIMISILILFSLIFFQKNYTRNVLFSVAISIMLILLLNRKIFLSANYWRSIIFCYLPFLIVNTTLTMLPIVLYNNLDTWGIRIISIPLEDFFYSFSLLSTNIAIYDLVKRKFNII